MTKKTGENACSFNVLYCDFLARHEWRFAGNARMRDIYSTWGRFSPTNRPTIGTSAATFLTALVPAEEG